jgi:hypothetical protein
LKLLLDIVDTRVLVQCTTCWNMGQALAAKNLDEAYIFPDMAMGCGTSAPMKETEREFIDRLLQGDLDAAPPQEDSWLAQHAAKIGGLCIGEIPEDAATASVESPSTSSSTRAPKRFPDDMISVERDAFDAHGAKRVCRDASSAQALLAASRQEEEEEDDMEGGEDDCGEDYQEDDDDDDEPRGGKRKRAASRSHSTGPGCRARQLPDWSVRILKEWLLSPEHFDFPWPTPEEKQELSERAGVDERQLGVWLTNARKRVWVPLRRRQGLPIPRYAEAKAERLQKEVVHRVKTKAEEEAVVAAAEEVPLPPPTGAHSNQVTSMSLARLGSALHAEQEQLAAERAALEQLRAEVDRRARLVAGADYALRGNPYSFGWGPQPQYSPAVHMMMAPYPGFVGEEDIDDFDL